LFFLLGGTTPRVGWPGKAKETGIEGSGLSGQVSGRHECSYWARARGAKGTTFARLKASRSMARAGKLLPTSMTRMDARLQRFLSQVL
jgi:hypothetical protein